jgi:mannose-6-phosphate isomerase-like protein (cupin superfamily)
VDQGDDEWEFIVAEVLPPEVLRPKGDPASVSRESKIVNLEQAGLEKMSEVFSGPWSEIALEQIAAGETREFNADQEEHAFYVVSGNGTATTELHTVQLGQGQGLAIPKAGRVSLTATSNMKLFRIAVAL